MEIKTLSVSKRESSGKGAARQARMKGEIPAVLYGEGKDPVSIQINRRTFEHLVHGRGGEHAVVKVEIENQPELSGPAMIKAVQHHPVKETIVHADFLRIRLDQKIQTMVPINITGRAQGIIDGGVPDQHLHELEIECLATEVPLQIDVDITALQIGESLHVSAIDAPAGVSILTELDRTVIAIHAPRVAKTDDEEAEAAEAAEAGAEKKDDDE